MLPTDLVDPLTSAAIEKTKHWIAAKVKNVTWKKQLKDHGEIILAQLKSQEYNFDYAVIEAFLKDSALENSLSFLRYPTETEEHITSQGARDLLLTKAHVLPAQREMVMQKLFKPIDAFVEKFIYAEGTPFEQFTHQKMIRGIQDLDGSMKAIAQTFCSPDADVSKIANSATVNPRSTLAIISFCDGTDHIDHASENTFTLCEMFDKRIVQHPYTWQDIMQRTVEFLRKQCKSSKKYELMLESHSSVAFVVGSVLTSVAGFDVHIKQKTHQGSTNAWHIDSNDTTPYDSWNIKTSKKNKTGKDLVVVISAATHDIAASANQYCEASNLSIAQFIYFNRGDKSLIQNGTHCKQLESKIIQTTKKHLEKFETDATIHLFVSGPNALSFYLGQDQRLLARTQLYEYHNRTYIPSILVG